MPSEANTIMRGTLADRYFDSLGTMQRIPENADYFDLFDLDGVNAPLATLDASYNELAELFNPERYAKKSDEEHKLALENSSMITKAYETLRDPDSRAAYLVQQVDASPIDPKSSEAARDMADIEQAVARWRAGKHGDDVKSIITSGAQTVQGQLDETKDSVQDILKKYDQTDDKTAVAAELKGEIASQQYLETLQGELNDILYKA